MKTLQVLEKYSVRILTCRSTFEVGLHLKYTVFPLRVNKVHFKYTLIVLQLYFLWESITLKVHFKYISSTTDLYLFFTRVTLNFRPVPTGLHQKVVRSGKLVM